MKPSEVLLSVSPLLRFQIHLSSSFALNRLFSLTPFTSLLEYFLHLYSTLTLTLSMRLPIKLRREGSSCSARWSSDSYPLINILPSLEKSILDLWQKQWNLSLTLTKYTAFDSSFPRVFSAAFNEFPTSYPLSTSNGSHILLPSPNPPPPSQLVLHTALKTPPFVTSS